MDVSIIIPTTASAQRRASLLDALRSLKAQAAVRVVPIVVVNGASYSNEIVDHLRGDPSIRYLYREQGSAPRAVAAGRAIIDTEYFGVLDDDDLYLPDALLTRAQVLAADPSIDVVVTNGYSRGAQGDSPMIEEFDLARQDPAAMLMRFNWLPSSAAMFRTATIGPEFFADAPTVVEWTYVALRLALTRKIFFLNVPTYVICTLTPESMSKSETYMRQAPAAIKRMMSLGAPPAVQKQLQKKYASALHSLSMHALAKGERYDAWRWHLASLGSAQGLAYLSYTRHLMKPRSVSRRGRLRQLP